MLAENLNLTQEKLDKLGFGQIGVLVKTSCMGDDWARIVQWTAPSSRWCLTGISPTRPSWIRWSSEAAAKYAMKKNITTPALARTDVVRRRRPAASPPPRRRNRQDRCNTRRKHRCPQRRRPQRAAGRTGIEVIYNHVILVLKGVSLQVPEGDRGLAGANGAGKTTTLRAVSNLLKGERGDATKGHIQYRGWGASNGCRPRNWSSGR